MSASAARIAARFDRLALDQLRAECVRLADENEALRNRLLYAESCAESWRDDALRMMDDHCARTGDAPGLTIDGRLVAVPASEVRQ